MWCFSRIPVLVSNTAINPLKSGLNGCWTLPISRQLRRQLDYGLYGSVASPRQYTTRLEYSLNQTLMTCSFELSLQILSSPKLELKLFHKLLTPHPHCRHQTSFLHHCLYQSKLSHQTSRLDQELHHKLLHLICHCLKSLHHERQLRLLPHLLKFDKGHVCASGQ